MSRVVYTAVVSVMQVARLMLWVAERPRNRQHAVDAAVRHETATSLTRPSETVLEGQGATRIPIRERYRCVFALFDE